MCACATSFSNFFFTRTVRENAWKKGSTMVGRSRREKDGGPSAILVALRPFGAEESAVVLQWPFADLKWLKTAVTASLSVAPTCAQFSNWPAPACSMSMHVHDGHILIMIRMCVSIICQTFESCALAQWLASSAWITSRRITIRDRS